MKELALSIPGFGTIEPPPTVPRGGAETLGNILSVAFSVLIVAAIIITIGFVAWGALNWITSGGEKQKVEKARKTITYAIVGMIISILSFVILRFVSDILGTGIYKP